MIFKIFFLSSLLIFYTLVYSYASAFLKIILSSLTCFTNLFPNWEKYLKFHCKLLKILTALSGFLPRDGRFSCWKKFPETKTSIVRFDKNYEEKILVFPDTHYNMSFAEDRTEAYLENPKYSLIYTIFFSKSGYFLLWKKERFL